MTSAGQTVRKKIISVNNITNSTSDHNIIEVNIILKGNIGAPTEIRKRKLKNWSTDRYRLKVENIDWSEMYDSTDVSRTYGIFEDKLRTVLDQEAPMSTFQLRNNYKPWVEYETKE